MKRTVVPLVVALILAVLAWRSWSNHAPAPATEGRTSALGESDDGSELDGLAELPAPGTESRTPAVDPTVSEPGPSVESESAPMTRVEGRVVDVEGQPFGGVSVWADGPDPQFMGPSTLSDAHGNYRLEVAPGPNTLRAKTQGSRTTGEAFEVPAGLRRAHGPTLVVEEARTLEGIVVDSRGVGVPGIPVNGHSMENGPFSTMVGGQRMTWGGDATATDAGGRFVLRGLEDEAHVVSLALAYRPGWSTEKGTFTDVYPGGDPLRFELRMADRVDVELFDAQSAAPVTRAIFDGVWMLEESGSRAKVSGVHMWSDTGKYSIRAEGSFSVSAREYEGVDVELVGLEDTGPLRVGLTPKELAAYLTLRVRTAAGEPVFGLRAEGWTSGSKSWEDREDGVAPPGELRIGGLDAGTHRIRLSGLGMVTRDVVAEVDERGHGFEEVLVESGWPVPIRFVDGGGRTAKGVELRVTHESGSTPAFGWRYRRPQGITITMDLEQGSTGSTVVLKEADGALEGLVAGQYRIETRWGTGPWRTHSIEVGEMSSTPLRLLP